MSTLKLPKAGRYRKQNSKYGAIDYKHDKSVLAFGTATEFYNFDVTSGALRTGYGDEDSDVVPRNAMRYWIYRFYSASKGKYVDQYVYQYNNGLLSMYDEDKGRHIYISGKVFSPFDAINYRLNSVDVLLLSCEGHKLITWNGTQFIEYENSPTIYSMALHNERLFVTSRDERTKVFFSKNLDPTQWEIGLDGGGFIEMLDERGFLNKVVSFGNYLYIFRDHGITRVTAFGDQTEFTVVNMFLTAGRIYPSSICTCGSIIMFLASDGLYAFDGYDCTRVLSNLDGLIVANDDCASAFHDGKYYLACRMDFNDGIKIGCEQTDGFLVNGLLVFDPASGEYSISRGMDIRYMYSASYNGVDFLMCNDGGRGGVITKCGMRFEDTLRKHWKSPPYDFSMPDKVKRLSDIYVTATPGRLTAEMDGRVVRELSDCDRYRVYLSGKTLSITLEVDTAECNISPIAVVYSVL